MPEETKNKYMVIDVSHLKAPVGCWGVVYRELGIIPIFHARAEELNIGHKNYILPQHILCNEKTLDKLMAMIRESWMYYSIDRNTGDFKYKNRKYVRHKTKTPIHHGDEGALAMDALCWSPSIDNDVPDDVFWLNLDLVPIRKPDQQ